MGQAEGIIHKDQIVIAAHRDNLNTIAQMIPYLRERKEAADRYIEGRYNEAANNLLFESIEYCNKHLAVILGIVVEQR